jgi:hypothetical protein
VHVETNSFTVTSCSSGCPFTTPGHGLICGRIDIVDTSTRGVTTVTTIATTTAAPTIAGARRIDVDADVSLTLSHPPVGRL